MPPQFSIFNSQFSTLNSQFWQSIWIASYPPPCRVDPFITCTIGQVGHLLPVSLLPTSKPRLRHDPGGLQFTGRDRYPVLLMWV